MHFDSTTSCTLLSKFVEIHDENLNSHGSAKTSSRAGILISSRVNQGWIRRIEHRDGALLRGEGCDISHFSRSLDLDPKGWQETTIKSKTKMEKVLAVGSHTTHLIHPSDYPKQLHVNEVLTDNNFADWSQEITNFLFAKNKIEFVDWTIKKPKKTSKDYMSWMRVDAMIKGWLTTAMEKNIRNSVKYAGSNKERSGTKAVKEGIEHYTECNKDGHKREGCFKLIGYPEWWPEKKGEKTKGKAACVETETSPIPGLTNEDYQYFLKHFSGTGNSKGTRPVANMAHKEDEEGEWIFDSGCTEYITYLSNILVNRKATHFEAPVIIPNGDSIPVKRKGDYVLQGGTKVNGVLYVPDFKCNLLSVSQEELDWCGEIPRGTELNEDNSWKKGPGYHFYFKNTDTKGDKFEEKGKPKVFLGYPPRTKGYKILDLETRKIIVSRDVYFHEENFPFKNVQGNNENGTEEPIICHDCHCHGEPILAQNKEQNPMEQDPQMDHNQIDKSSGPHETHDGDETGQINDEGQPNNAEFETNESNEGEKAQAKTIPTRTRTRPSRFKDFIVQVPHSVKHSASTSNQVASTTLEDLPKGKRAIDSKWVYKIKFKPNDEVERYKARLVVKGFTQKEWVDYHDTFTQVAKLVTIQTLLVVAVKRDWIIHQLDVNNAFLHGDLDEDQASRNWYHKFTTFLSGLSFRHSKADHSLFIYQTASIMVVVLIYVDDIIITRNCLNKIQEIKKQLDKEFSVKDLGPLKYFLGIEVAKTSDGLVLSQRKYTLDILKDSGKLGCKPSSFPIEQGLKLDKGENEPSIDASQYRRLIGRLLYLQATRPDITYFVNVLSQFVADPRNNHLEAANRVLRYLKATPGQGILLSRAGDPVLTAYCDSDWLGCSFTRRSRTDYFLLLGGTPIFWKTKKQSVVSRSSAKAEYRAMASTISEVI
ncbi:putative RNA-directed DNA polymerase [Tanacetum coccineum]